MAISGTVYRGHWPSSGTQIYYKTDAIGPPTDTELTNLGVALITDSIQVWNTQDKIMYVRYWGSMAATVPT
jgi:hypothetical protein